jgi:hypothetical protein
MARNFRLDQPCRVEMEGHVLVLHLRTEPRDPSSDGRPEQVQINLSGSKAEVLEQLERCLLRAAEEVRALVAVAREFDANMREWERKNRAEKLGLGVVKEEDQ